MIARNTASATAKDPSGTTCSNLSGLHFFRKSRPKLTQSRSVRCTKFLLYTVTLLPTLHIPSGCGKASSPLCSGPSFWFPYLLCPLRSTSFCLPLSGMFKPCSAPPSPGSERSSPRMPSLICVVAPLLPLLQRRHEISVRCVDSPVLLMSSVERMLHSVTVA